MKAAAIQFSAQSDKDKNVAIAARLAKRAIRRGAKLIVLPEIFHYRGRVRGLKHLQEIAENIPGPSIKPLQQIAKDNKVMILAGSIYAKAKGQRKVYNTSVMIGPDGKIKASYRKIHLFDAFHGQNAVRESARFLAGKKPVMVNAGGFKTGLSICFDLRFPELYAKYFQQGVEILCIPSAFTHQTGKAHWEVLLRARAIENQAYVIAPNQFGTDEKNLRHYGHSMIIDPWGKVLARAAGNKEAVITAEISKQTIKKIKSILPGIQRG